MVKAVLDLGTNTFHLLIAQLAGGDLEIFVDEKEAVRVGEKGMLAGTITEAALHRAIHTLLNFKTTMENFGRVDEVAVIATSAFRNANNAPEICAAIKDATGFEVTIISGDQEAQLIFEVVKLSGALSQESAMIVDIGGGSVEFIICHQKGVLWKQSFEIGGLRLIERFHKTDPILTSEINAIMQYFQEELAALHQAVKTFNPSVLIGSSGAFDTYIDIHHATNNLLDPGLNATVLPLASYLNLHEALIQKTREERLSIPGMIPLRVDMIVVASCLTKYLIDTYQLKEIITSRYALKEGVFAHDL